MVFIYSTYQKFCSDVQQDAQKKIQENLKGNILLKIPMGALEGTINTAFLSFAGNLILSKGKLQPAIQGTLWGLSIKILELVTRIVYQMLQDYSALARQQTVSNKINASGEIIVLAVSGMGLWGATHFLKISKISILATSVLLMLRKITGSVTVEIIFWIPPITFKGNYGDYLQSLSTLVHRPRY
jgi:hypothetical protein